MDAFETRFLKVCPDRLAPSRLVLRMVPAILAFSKLA
jgi:hypothetical protein